MGDALVVLALVVLVVAVAEFYRRHIAEMQRTISDALKSCRETHEAAMETIRIARELHEVMDRAAKELRSLRWQATNEPMRSMLRERGAAVAKAAPVPDDAVNLTRQSLRDQGINQDCTPDHWGGADIDAGGE